MNDAPLPIHLHLLERLIEDRDRGELLPQEEYAKRFPGLESEIAEHFARMGEAAADGEAGRHIGRYRLVAVVGRGGQGVVHHAVDTDLGRDVALKLLTGLNVLDPRAMQRFLREARATSGLNHPGICPIYEHGQEDGMPYIAMGFVEGSTLAEQIARQQEPARPLNREAVHDLLVLFESIARALHVAHLAGVVHRDIKPANLMIRPDGQPVLLDFGVAQVLEDDAATITGTGHALGTPAYMSPEQVEGRAKAVDLRSDVYSLGVTLFEALTGRRPFTAATRQGLYRQILHDPAPDVRKLSPHIPRDLGSVLETVLAKDPDERYASAELLADDLAHVRLAEPIRASPPSALRRLGKWAARNPSWVAGLLVASVLLAAGIFVISLQVVRAEDAIDEWTRLADADLLDTLFEQAEGWSSVPDPASIPELEDWLSRAESLVSRRDQHAAALDTLRQRAQPQSDEDRAADRLHYAHEYSALAELPRERIRIAGDEAALKDLAEYERKIHQRVARRRNYTFDDPALQLQENVLGDLVRRLGNIQVPAASYHVTLDAMQQRLDKCRAILGRFQGEDAEPWRLCTTDVAQSNPAYAGLALKPVPGLVPLGVDENSGLWEFWHVASGERPEWVGIQGGTGHIRLHQSSGSEGLVLVLLPGGTFSMGSDAHEDEQPVQAVTLAPFLMSKYEVTRAQWLRARREDPAKLLRHTQGGVARHPIVHVNWHECLETTRRWQVQFPTEAQWEYACRAGTTTPYSTGVEGASLLGSANVLNRTAGTGIEDLKGNSVEVPVGSLEPNPWGLHDMHGNVAEWCRDPFFPYHEWTPDPGDGMRGTLSPVAWNVRVVRPGSFQLHTAFSRSAARVHALPGFSSDDIGFRVIAEAPIAQ